MLALNEMKVHEGSAEQSFIHDSKVKGLPPTLKLLLQLSSVLKSCIVPEKKIQFHFVSSYYQGICIQWNLSIADTIGSQKRCPL